MVRIRWLDYIGLGDGCWSRQNSDCAAKHINLSILHIAYVT